VFVSHGDRAAVRATPLEVGESFGPRYHIIKLLGAGGMGAVYRRGTPSWVPP